MFGASRPQIDLMDSYMQHMELRYEKAAVFLEKMGYKIIKQNGQRISINSALNEDKMEEVRYNEVFIGKLPRDLFEDELYEHLASLNCTIYKIRYMMDFSKTNRGFCFVKFQSTEEAVRAISQLDGKIVRPDCAPIGAKISFDNKCLFFGNLPPECTAEAFVKALQKAEIYGIVGARIAQDSPSCDFNLNRKNQMFPSQHNRHPLYRPQPQGRYCYVDFITHDAATQARRILLPGDVKILNRKLTLDWAKSEVPSEISEAMRRCPFNQTNQLRHRLEQQHQYEQYHRQQYLNEYLLKQQQCRNLQQFVQKFKREQLFPARQHSTATALRPIPRNEQKPKPFCTEWEPPKLCRA